MRLEGWKEIATHLGVSIGEAQGFEGIGLPVRRLLGGGVWTTTEALWLWKCGVEEVCEHLAKRFTRPPDAVLH